MAQEPLIGNPITVGIVGADGEVEQVALPERGVAWPETTGVDTLIVTPLKIALTTSLVTIAIAFNPLVVWYRQRALKGFGWRSVGIASGLIDCSHRWNISIRRSTT